MINITLEEQETTINFSRTQDAVDVWTSDKTVMTKLDKLCISAPNFYKLVAEHRAQDDVGAITSKEYRISDKRMLSFRSMKRTYNLTEEQKRKRAEQLNGAK